MACDATLSATQFAREREAAAHASMAERCAQVTNQLRITELKLQRTQAALEPSLKRPAAC